MSIRKVFISLLILYSCTAYAEELTPAKRDDIWKLMQITGSSQIAQQFANAMTQDMFNSLKAARPDIPDRAFDIMHRELIALFSERMDKPGGLLDQIVPIYHRYYTHREIKELLAFYETSVGKKTIAVLPKIVIESMAVGRKWGESLGPEISRRVEAALKREGITLPEK